MLEAFSLLPLGFIFGLQHAFDADHIVAAAVLSASVNKKSALLRGILWGLGHTLVLFIMGIFVLILGIHIPASFGDFFEFLVALMLIVLGIKAFFHSHPQSEIRLFRSPSFFVGMIHGLAGSAVILLFILSNLQSTFFGFLYIIIFGLGSMIGMALLSFVVSVSALKFQKYTGIVAGIFSLSLGILLLLPKAI